MIEKLVIRKTAYVKCRTQDKSPLSSFSVLPQNGRKATSKTRSQQKPNLQTNPATTASVFHCKLSLYAAKLHQGARSGMAARGRNVWTFPAAIFLLSSFSFCCCSFKRSVVSLLLAASSTSPAPAKWETGPGHYKSHKRRAGRGAWREESPRRPLSASSLASEMALPDTGI